MFLAWLAAGTVKEAQAKVKAHTDQREKEKEITTARLDTHNRTMAYAIKSYA